MTASPWRLRRRWRCHGTLWCCQFVDRASCNSWADRHRLARRRYRRLRAANDTAHRPRWAMGDDGATDV